MPKVPNYYALKSENEIWRITNNIFIENKEIQKFHPKLKNSPKILSKLLLDVDDWYSITPPEVVEKFIKTIVHAATQSLTNPKTILCAYSGVGGDALVLMKHGFNIIANDIEYKKVKFLKNNLKVVKEEQNINGKLQCIVKDFFCVEKADFEEKPFVSFISPPWGGVYYRKISNIDEKIDILRIKEHAETLADNAVYFLPRNMENSLKTIFGVCKIQRAYLKKKFQGFLVYKGKMFVG